jgi:nicotinamide-nucleotide amidase
MPTEPPKRQLLTAEILSIGTELTVGETSDTNGGELARVLTLEGVTVGRITALPDRLELVTGAFEAGLERADLVVSTGGLGPTPDDLTRESIAAALGETPVIDPELEAWLRSRWERRGLPFPEINLKQAWVIPSCEALANPNGSAPGWLATRDDGHVVVALPGPPREMRPMWRDEVLPRLRTRGLGRDVVVRTFRLTGIGESQVAEILGEELLRRPDPEVATYARLEAVDVRVSSSGEAAQARVDEAATIVLDRLGQHVWAEGATTWSEAIGERLERRSWLLGVEEIGTGGQLAALLGDVGWLGVTVGHVSGTHASRVTPSTSDGDRLIDRARHLQEVYGVDVGLVVNVRARGTEFAVTIAVATPDDTRQVTRTTYTGGLMGRSQAALLAAAALVDVLGPS